MAILTLSNINPDYEAIRAQLQADLNTKAAWKDLLPTQTGQTLLDWIATIGAHGQVKALRYAQDAYSETAVADRAQYAIADMQGLRLTRKLAASIDVTMHYTQPVGGPATVTLPAFTQFQGAGTYWYTNVPYVINNGANVHITLYQGYVMDQVLAGLGTSFQTFISPEKGFTVSNADVYVWINTTQLTKTTEGLWLFKGEEAFLDRTTPSGQLMVQFGNGTYGSKPEITDQVRIVYAVTSGLDGNSIQTAGKKMAQTNNSIDGLSYVVNTNSEGGANEPAAALYKQISASNFGSFGSAVTRAQYASTALEYPGILDAKTFAQRELDPNDLRLMNTFKVVPITSGVWNSGQKTAFLNWLQDRTMYSGRFYWEDPTAVLRNVTLTIFCRSWATLSDCEADAQAAITALFAARAGIIGYDITLSDIDAACREANPGIEYIDIQSPTTDMQVSGRAMGAPATTEVAGTLAAGTYTYAIYANDGHGLTAPQNYSSQIVTGTLNGVKLDWLPYPDATAYYVVGRMGPTFGVIATLAPNVLTFTDDGTITPTGTLPTPADYPVLYNKLSSVVIASEYSTRRI